MKYSTATPSRNRAALTPQGQASVHINTFWPPPLCDCKVKMRMIDPRSRRKNARIQSKADRTCLDQMQLEGAPVATSGAETAAQSSPRNGLQLKSKVAKLPALETQLRSSLMASTFLLRKSSIISANSLTLSSLIVALIQVRPIRISDPIQETALPRLALAYDKSKPSELQRRMTVAIDASLCVLEPRRPSQGHRHKSASLDLVPVFVQSCSLPACCEAQDTKS